MLRSWRARLQKLLTQPFAMRIDQRAIDRAIEVIAAEIIDHAPAYECPCKGDPDCPRCQGLGWTTHHQIEIGTMRDLVPLCEASLSDDPT